MTDQELLDKDLSELIGLSSLPDDERDDMLARIGELILEAVILRVVADLPDEKATELEAYMKTNPDPVVLLDALGQYAEDIDAIFREEVIAFKRECIAVMERQQAPVHV